MYKNYDADFPPYVEIHEGEIRINHAIENSRGKDHLLLDFDLVDKYAEVFIVGHGEDDAIIHIHAIEGTLI